MNGVITDCACFICQFYYCFIAEKYLIQVLHILEILFNLRFPKKELRGWFWEYVLTLNVLLSLFVNLFSSLTPFKAALHELKRLFTVNTFFQQGNLLVSKWAKSWELERGRTS